MYPLVKTSINLIAIASLLVAANVGWAQSSTLQDIGSKVAADKYPHVTIYKAKEIITLDPVKPKAEAVAVVGNRILATGTLQELKTAIGDQKYSIDETFAGKVIVPGFISQHDHPVLTALTMASEVLAIEEWALPTRTIPAVKDKEDFIKRLSVAEQKLSDPDTPLVTWGYHPSFFGHLTR